MAHFSRRPLFSQLYSQVWWSGLAPTPFPADVIERYDGRGMLIAGFEMDQVRRPKGCECPEGGACKACAEPDIPVPLTVVSLFLVADLTRLEVTDCCIVSLKEQPRTLQAYNHHFESSLRGKKARFEKVKFTGEDDPRLVKLLEDRAAMGMGGHGQRNNPPSALLGVD